MCDSLDDIKKLVLKINASALFFIGLYVNPCQSEYLRSLILRSLLNRKRCSGSQFDVAQSEETKKGLPEETCQPMKNSVTMGTQSNQSGVIVRKLVKKKSCIRECNDVVTY